MEKKRLKLLGMDWPYFLVFAAITLAAMYFDFLPGSLAGMIPLLLILGEGLRFIGDRIPIVKDYLGGGSIVVLFGSAALVMYGIIPAETAEATKEFMSSHWINYALAALVCGSIFGMDRKLLVKSSLRYIPCILGAVLVSLVAAGLVGKLLGFTVAEAVLYIGLPIMGGGTSAGAVPMSQMFGELLGKDPGAILAMMTPAVALGNAFAIISAGFLDKLGKMKPSWTGNGMILKTKGDLVSDNSPEKAEPIVDLSVFATGMLVASVFLALGMLIQKFVPSIHAYAWMIILMIIVKILGWLPESIETACKLWYQFFIKNFTNLLLAGLGVGLISLEAVLPALTPTYLLLVLAVVIGAMIGSALVGLLVGFYPIEAAITGGLCMANMGGSGDIATLGAAKRMELMPFAAVSSRLGGALILILGSILLSILT